MHSGSDVGILSMHINNDLAIVCVETDVIAREADFSADAASDLLKVDLILINADFSEKNDL